MRQKKAREIRKAMGPVPPAIKRAAYKYYNSLPWMVRMLFIRRLKHARDAIR